MTNIWDLNCCGEFKATMKIIQAISDLGELEKAAKIRENYKVFLVRCLSKIRFWMFPTFCSVAATRAMLPSKCTRVFYVDEILISTGAAQVSAVLPSDVCCLDWTVRSGDGFRKSVEVQLMLPDAGLYIDPHLSVTHNRGFLLFTALFLSFSISANIHNTAVLNTESEKKQILFH